MSILNELEPIIESEQKMQSIRDNLRSRGVDPDRTGLIVDEKSNQAYFFLYNLSGKLVGYQKYNPAGEKVRGGKIDKDLMKYYSYVTGDRKDKSKEIAVWGLQSYDMKIPYLFAVEGIFDAASLHNADVPAIATLSNDPDDKLTSWLKTLPQKIIVVSDRDDAGRKLQRVGDYKFMVPAPYKDLNEMPQDEVNAFVKEILGEINAI